MVSRLALTLTASLTLALAVSAGPVLSLRGAEPAQQAAAACTKAPKWTSTTTRYGMSLSASDGGDMGDDLRQEVRRFDTRIPVIRTFDTGMPRSNAWEQRREWFGKRWNITSLKLSPQSVLSGRHDSALRHYFKTAPRDVPIFYSFFHEPEDDVKRGDFTARQYRRAFRHVVNIASSFCRSNLYPTLILMNWTANPSSGLNWRSYYPGGDYVSVIAWDAYNGANGYARTYRAPKDIFGHTVAASRSVGKRFAIAETGTVRINGDSDGSGRAEWLRKVNTYLTNKNAAWVSYFQSLRNGDFELRDRPSVGRWARVMESAG